MSVSNLLDLNEVKSNTSKLTKACYIQRPPDKSVNGAEFIGGNITYNFHVAGNRWWVPSKTYFSLRCTVGKNTAYEQPDLVDDIAPAPMFTSGLFNSVDFRIANNSVSRTEAYVGQVQACRNRLTKSKAWRDTMGRTVYMTSDFSTRQALVSTANQTGAVGREALGFDATSTIAVAADTGVLTLATVGTSPSLATVFVIGDIIEVDLAGGAGTVSFTVSRVTDATHLVLGPSQTIAITAAALEFRRVRDAVTVNAKNIIEVPFQPPLGIFDCDTPLPPGEYSFVFSPNTGKMNFASLQSTSGPNTTAAIKVESMYLYLYTVEGETPPKDYVHYLDLQEVRCQPKALVTSSGEQQLDFVVSPSTYAVSMAIQETSAGSSTEYPPQMFKLQSDQHLSLSRYRIQYANETQPQPDGDPEYKNNIDRMTKVYHDSQMASNMYFSPGGCEEYDEWLTGYGPLVHHMWLKPSGDTSTALTAAVTLSTAPTSGNLLIFDWSSTVSQISVRDGRVFSVQSEQA